MKLPDCVWYVSGFRQPWEADVIGNLADAAKSRGAFSLRVCVKGGTAGFSSEAVVSWDSLTFFERLKAVLFGGRKLWHLWGDAPFWWGLVRLRARTVHTSLSKSPRWRGHPTRLFKEQASGGENRILPTFEPKASWADFSRAWPDDRDDSALVLAMPDEVSGERGDILEAWASVSNAEARVLVTGSEPTHALQAAYMTMRGVPVVARDTPFIRELLGPGGFVAAPPGGKSEWEKALRLAASEAGRSSSAAARRFLKENYSASAAAESLENLYGSVVRGKI